jgi:hypothetical protein
MLLPAPRGPLGDRLRALLRETDPTTADSVDLPVEAALADAHDLLTDDDVQLTLFCLYELHYRGFDDVDDRWEWEPGLLGARRVLEDAFERTLRARVQVPELAATSAEAVADALFAMAAQDTGPGLARHVGRLASAEQLRELLVQRSVYQLKEADPHTWAVPRLRGGPKAALVEIQADEYGGGDPERMHSALFARTMRDLGLDDTYGRYVEQVPAITLASLNTMSLFGLHRRLRGAVAGHLAAFEMTSSLPNRFYGNGFRRHGYGPATTDYFDEHVEADAVHEQIAGRDLAGGLAREEPGLAPDILFGAAACLALDDAVAEHIMSRWLADRSSLRSPGDRAAPAVP